MRTLETEVLVIGGGLAGLRAAIAAARNGVSTILASKSAIGAGCNSILAGGGFAMAVFGFTAEDHARVTLDAGQHVNDRKLVQKLVQNSAKEADFLKETGVGLSPQAFGCRVDTETNAGGRINGGNILMKKIARAAHRSEHLRLIPYFFVYRILLSGNRVSGAIGFEKDGTPCLIWCKAIILATGGGAAIYARTDNCKGIVGDGYALALEAGLSLADMEFVQFYPLGFAERGLPKTIIFPPIPAEAWMHDAEGDDLLKKHRIDMNLHDFVVAARDRASHLIYKESQQGAVFLNYTHVPDEKWAEYPLTLFPRQHFNFEEKPFRITPMAHFVMGGVTISVSTETDVRGFFGAGEVTAGVHGANRLGGNALTECLVFGATSGLCASDYAKNARFKHVTFKADQWMGSLLRKKSHANTRVALSAIMRSVRDIAWKYAGPVRNETGMRKGLSLLEEMTMALERVAVDTTTDLVSRKEVADSLLLTKAILLSSLARQESIGAFQRDDFPQRSTSASFRRAFVRLDEKEHALKVYESYEPLTGELVNVKGAESARE
jgi:fumarate reductase (CoM/CoB) subunit A